MIFNTGFLIVTGLLAFAKRATAIKCFACAGNYNSDCARMITSSMVTQVCEEPSFDSNPFMLETEGSRESKIQSVCINLVVSGYQPNLIAKGCANVPGKIDPCSYFKSIQQIKACSSCKTDWCNGEGN